MREELSRTGLKHQAESRFGVTGVLAQERDLLRSALWRYRWVCVQRRNGGAPRHGIERKVQVLVGNSKTFKEERKVGRRKGRREVER